MPREHVADAYQVTLQLWSRAFTGRAVQQPPVLRCLCSGSHLLHDTPSQPDMLAPLISLLMTGGRSRPQHPPGPHCACKALQQMGPTLWTRGGEQSSQSSMLQEHPPTTPQGNLRLPLNPNTGTLKVCLAWLGFSFGFSFVLSLSLGCIRCRTIAASCTGCRGELLAAARQAAPWSSLAASRVWYWLHKVQRRAACCINIEQSCALLWPLLGLSHTWPAHSTKIT